MNLIPIENCKTELVHHRSKYLHPKMAEILLEMITWLKGEGVAGVVTESVTTLVEDARLGRKSITHREGRAGDIRTLGWSKELIAKFQNHFNLKYGKLGALSPTTMEPSLIVYHDSGHGAHMHVQLNKSYAVKMPKELAA